jgi:hypothetical protein
MPFRSRYLAEMPTPRVKDAEERQLPSPAVCAWVGKVGRRPWVSPLSVECPRWDAAVEKPHIRAERAALAQAQARVPEPEPGRARAQGQVRSRVLIG